MEGHQHQQLKGGHQKLDFWDAAFQILFQEYQKRVPQLDMFSVGLREKGREVLTGV
jgi:hypothetical protein